MVERKYFGTDGIRGRVGQSLINPEFVLRLGYALGCVLAEEGGSPRVLIGKDTRVSGYLLESALQAGLSAAGINILLLGPMPTPGIAYLTRTFRSAAGIVISASHNPYEDNGIKFFSASGTKLPDEQEKAIELYLDKPITTVSSRKLGKARRIVDAQGRYIEFCKSTIRSAIRLNGLKIVVDCANGATYHVAPDIFRELGADIIEIGTSPNGFNINADCGSTHPALLVETVKKEGADLGIAFDGDGDRVIMVDASGRVIDGDELLYIIALDRQKQGYLAGGIVGTVMTNFALEKMFEQNQIPFVRTAVGDRYVMAELLRRGWCLGGEASGHLVCLDKTSTGDGIIAALQVLQVLISQEKSLSDLLIDLVKVPQVLLNVPIRDKQKAFNDPKLQDLLKSCESDLRNKGRILLRPSGTEELVRVMVEGEDRQEIEKIANQLADYLAESVKN